MAQINKPDTYFNTVLWTGDGTTPRNITGVGFQPDLVWAKGRSVAEHHVLTDAVRGGNKQLYSSLNLAEGSSTDRIQSFDSDGFTIGDATAVNQSSATYVAWNWLASNTTASNTDGSITSTVSANTTSGFSIVTWSGSGATGTIGHGLGTEPSVIIPKCRTQTADWYSYWKPLGNGNAIRLNTTDASAATGIWNSTSPTSSVFSVINNTVVNQSGHTYVAYCFAEKKGFSKFGSYTGNGNADGTFVYTGFKPAWLMIKRTDSADAWFMFDNKRAGAYSPNTNPSWEFLLANATNTGANTDRIDLYSNGFKMRYAWDSINASGGTYIYMAFAENPLVGTNNIPATAR